MKHLRPVVVFMLVAFAFTCFFSMPVLSTDEWPWDADDDPGAGGGVKDCIANIVHTYPPAFCDPSSCTQTAPHVVQSGSRAVCGYALALLRPEP